MGQPIHIRAKSRKRSIHILVILIVLASRGSLLGGTPDIRILVTGDILLSRLTREEYGLKQRSPWEYVQELFHSADIVAGNLEGAIGRPPSMERPKSESPQFDIHESDIPMLRDAGYNIIALENNHSLDFGKEGKARTIRALRKAGVTPLSLDDSPYFMTIHGVTIAWLNYNYVGWRDSMDNNLPPVSVRRQLRFASKSAGIVIVVVHWGSELLDWPDRHQRRLARWFIAHGADVIIGGHPHVIQPVEIIDGKPVFFSLGNHLFDQKYPDSRTGLIADLRIKDGKLSCRSITTHTRPHSYFPAIIDSTDYQFPPFPLRTPDLTMGGTCIQPHSISNGSGEKIIFEGMREGKKLWSTRSQEALDITRGKLDGKRDLIFVLERHFSDIDRENGIRPYVYAVGTDGFTALWRGSGLAWPLTDALIDPVDNRILCALHRADSFIDTDSSKTGTRIMAYTWNGFGFTGVHDTDICERCRKLLGE
jgi:hypothetical protein